MFRKSGLLRNLVVLSSFVQLRTSGLPVLLVRLFQFLFARLCFSFFFGSRRHRPSGILKFQFHNFFIFEIKGTSKVSVVNCENAYEYTILRMEHN
jgi:hypothetical protein